jgi:hypothetical protein
MALIIIALYESILRRDPSAPGSSVTIYTKAS